MAPAGFPRVGLHPARHPDLGLGPGFDPIDRIRNRVGLKPDLQPTYRQLARPATRLSQSPKPDTIPLMPA